MPELPEVETIVQEMRAVGLVGDTVIAVHVHWGGVFHKISSAAVAQLLRQRTIKQIARRGKFIVFSFDGESCLVHLRMTGKFVLVAPSAPIAKHEHVRLIFASGQALAFEDQRKFGRWYFLEEAQKKLQEIGLEPLSEEFTRSAFKQCLRRSSRQIKPFLLDQHQLAGLGNIYVDEALWEACIHPERRVDTLTEAEVEALYQAIPKVLEHGIANKGTSLGSTRSNYFSVSGQRGGNQYKLKVFRQQGRPCPRCQERIVKARVAQRGTHFCPRCQK